MDSPHFARLRLEPDRAAIGREQRERNVHRGINASRSRDSVDNNGNLVHLIRRIYVWIYIAHSRAFRGLRHGGPPLAGR